MKRGRARVKRRKRVPRRSAKHRRPVRRSRASKKKPVELRFRALIGILTFLYMLKLIDAKTFRKIAKDISPRTAPAKRRRRRAKK